MAVDFGAQLLSKGRWAFLTRHKTDLVIVKAFFITSIASFLQSSI